MTNILINVCCSLCHSTQVQGLQTGCNHADVQSASILHSVMLPPSPNKEQWKSGLMESEIWIYWRLHLLIEIWLYWRLHLLIVVGMTLSLRLKTVSYCPVPTYNSPKTNKEWRAPAAPRVRARAEIGTFSETQIIKYHEENMTLVGRLFLNILSERFLLSKFLLNLNIRK